MRHGVQVRKMVKCEIKLLAAKNRMDESENIVTMFYVEILSVLIISMIKLCSKGEKYVPCHSLCERYRLALKANHSSNEDALLYKIVSKSDH